MYTCRGCMFTMSNALETDDRTSLIIVGTRELEITHNKKITKEIRKEKAIEYANSGPWLESMRMYGLQLLSVGIFLVLSNQHSKLFSN